MKDFAIHSRQFTLTLLALIVFPASTETGDSRMAERTAVTSEPEAAHRYLGRTPPGDTPELFAPGVVSTEAVELNSVFSPDGREFFFTRLIEGPHEQEGYPGKTRPILHHMVYADSAWTEPGPLRLFPDAPHAWAADMAVSPDGQLLYFMGAHPVDADVTRSDLNLWVSSRVDGTWSVAEPLPESVNSRSNEIYSSVVADGSLYFKSNREGSLGDSDLWRAQRLPDSSFADALNLDPPINGEHRTGDTYLAPDESYMVLTSIRPGGYGGGDLYVSFRQTDGAWGEPINLGPDVNSKILEYCPMVNPDGKYLFFSRRRSDPPESGWTGVAQGEVYWVDATVVERLRPNSAQKQ